MIKLNKKGFTHHLFLKKGEGFTLIELLVVIAIIALLSTIAVVSLGGARVKARDAKRVADVKQMQTALEMYFNNNNSYLPLASATITATNFNAVIKTPPLAPTPRDGTCSETTENPYIYAATEGTPAAACTTGLCHGYQIQFCLGATTGGLSAGVHCATQDGIETGIGACSIAITP
ncbi:type II secretion system protein [Candidatus Kuenenbacteria bacterium]|nr:type II secretion system protein [Candidatus Kuenenbacteria bacterium]